MTVGTNYSTPVMVNGYACKNCTDVDLAKKHIDPQHPQSGPYNVNAATDPTRQTAVSFGGSLSGLNNAASNSVTAARATQNSGNRLDVLA